MCGIAGVINYHGYDLEALKKALLHRGPDEQAIYCENNLALVHTRLAIQDVNAGQQPMHYDACSIIFNGEIYNHLALRKLLPQFQFKTQSDTETLLYLYLAMGTEMFNLLDGMYAFCIYDRNKQQLFLARDRAGKKPLYYMQQNNSFIFASELNALKCLNPLMIDEEAIASYLRTGFFYHVYTPYRAVQALAAGSYLWVNLDNLSAKSIKYFDIFDHYAAPRSPMALSSALNQVDTILHKSVSDRLLSSDLEVGVFLSGGIDSNLIAAIASRIRSNIRTFTVKTTDGFDESHLAKQGAEKYGTVHTELSISVDLHNDIEKILSGYGCPFMDSSAIPSYYVAREARQYVSVVLNGDGADELFGGYRRYVSIANKLCLYFRYFSHLRTLLPHPSNKQSRYNYFYRLLSMANKRNIDFYLAATTDIFEDVISFEKNALLSEMNAEITKVFANNRLSPLNQMLYLDFNFLLFSDLLVKMDIATMAHSLEGRSPFLSIDMLKFAPSLPDRFKINKLETKVLLRELAKKYLPITLIKQPKRGFEVPLVTWVTKDLKNAINDVLATGCYAENYVKRDIIQRLLDRKIAIHEEKRAKILWNLFCLEIWYKNEPKNKGMNVI